MKTIQIRNPETNNVFWKNLVVPAVVKRDNYK